MYPLNEVASALAQTAEPVVFDVGANCGLFSALVFDRWRAARVHAFEPQKKLVAQIEEFAAINQLADRLSANWCAVSETQGEAQFHLNRNPIGSSLVREKVGGRRRRSVRVPLTTLDGYARQRGITRVDLVKLDVEGSELEALRGAQTILATAQALFAEFHPPHSRYRDAAPMLETFGLQPLRPCDDSAQSNCVFVRAR
jgi:FkbM family methyltransferase